MFTKSYLKSIHFKVDCLSWAMHTHWFRRSTYIQCCLPGPFCVAFLKSKQSTLWWIDLEKCTMVCWHFKMRQNVNSTAQAEKISCWIWDALSRPFLPAAALRLYRPYFWIADEMSTNYCAPPGRTLINHPHQLHFPKILECLSAFLIPITLEVMEVFPKFFPQ